MLRGAKVNLYIRVMEKLGISANKLLAGTNVDLDSLSDQNYTISQAAYHGVIFNMLKISEEPGIAFLIGREFNAFSGFVWDACAQKLPQAGTAHLFLRVAFRGSFRIREA